MPKKIIQDVIAQGSRSSKNGSSSEGEKDSERDAFEHTAFKPLAPEGISPEFAREDDAHNTHSASRHMGLNGNRARDERGKHSGENAEERWRSDRDRIDSSPLFQRMKEKREERGNFSPEFGTPSKSWFGGGMKSAYAYLSLGVALFALLLFAYGAFFGGAKVEVFPKRSQVTLSDAPLSIEANGVDFQIMTVSLEDSRELPASGEKYTEKKASGKIVIYNDFDENEQRLVKNTRFESPEGKIYRITESVTVPGKKGGKPGTLEATVYADLPGEEYNIAETRFTVPGFEGTPRFEKFYAESKMKMTGGFQGNMKTVSGEALEAAKTELETSLRGALWQKALAEKPAGAVIWQSIAAYDFSYSSSDAGSESVREEAAGTLFVGVFDIHTFSRMLAAPSLGLSPDEKVLANGIESLLVEMKDVNVLKSGDSAAAEVLVNGSTDIVWMVDKAKLAEALVGTEKKEYSGIFGKFPEIERARVTITPFWRSRFPDNPEDITIEVADSGADGGSGS